MGRVTGITNNLGGAATTHDLAQTFNYNPAGQIASVARSNDAYAWQAHYNVDRSYVADGLNRILNAGGFAFGYDGRGTILRRYVDGPGGDERWCGMKAQPSPPSAGCTPTSAAA